MNNFFTRVTTALLFGIVFIVGIWYNQYTLIILFAFVTLLSLIEFYKLIFSNEQKIKHLFSVLTGLILFSTISLVSAKLIEIKYLVLSLLMLPILFIEELYHKGERPFDVIAKKIIGTIYLAIPFALFCSLGFIQNHFDYYNYEIPLGFIFLLWASDTGAYLVGIKWGKHRLFERISPKKSWEGFVGGFFISMCVAAVISYYFKSLDSYHWYSMSVLIVVFGTWGDLVESMFKRSLAVKDSGTILPGHGGILDRFDGMFLSAPIVYAYLVLFL